MSRRKFIGVTGGLTFAISIGGIGCTTLGSSRKEGPPVVFNAWVQVRTDNSVVIYNPAVEMGQGSMTALPVILAEEMDADWSRVIIEESPIDRETYGHNVWGMGPWMGIVGSIAVHGYFDRLRIAGAQARKILMMNAAKKWEVDLNELSTKPGLVVHQKSNRQLTFGEIASFGTMPAQLPEIGLEQLKDPNDFRLIGTVIPRRDVPEKVRGEAIYSMDISLPDMVYASVKHALINKSTPFLLNGDEVSQMPNVVKTVILENGVGVIATTIQSAFKAKDQLNIEWSSDVLASGYDSQMEALKYPEAIDDSTIERKEIVNEGSVENVKGIVKSYTADYYNDYTYHAQMEPLNAVVSLAKDKQSAEIWVGTQAPDSALRDAAEALELDESQITLNRCYLGGGFGRRAARDYLVEACHLAKAVDKPVKLVWNREEDVKAGMFRPATLQRIKAGVDVDGNLISWEYCTTGPGRGLISTGSSIRYYDIPNQKIEAKHLDHGIRTRSWRAEGHGANKFAIEAFVDEIASDQKVDSMEYRRGLLKNSPRALAVLNRVAKMSNWGKANVANRSMGLSFAERDSITACVCEISLNQNSGKIKVHQVWMAVDAGIVVQPDNATAQIEGAIIMGMSSALSERITFKNGEVEQSNFHDYNVLRHDDAPERIDVEFISSTEHPTGIGEAGLPAVGGAIANAFASMTGKRLYHMPFTTVLVMEAIKA